MAKKKSKKAEESDDEDRKADLAEQACKLECSKRPLAKEFVGPVKIILIDPSNKDYKRRIWGAALLGLANLLMGATVITVIFFSLNFRIQVFSNAHVIIGTIGLQMFLPTGILMLNSLFGGASPLVHRHRRWDHIFLMFMGLCFGLASAVLAIMLGGYLNFLTDHSIAGLASVVCGSVAWVFGPLLYFCNQLTAIGKLLQLVHRFLGLASMGAASGCFLLGILRPSFMAWGNQVLKYMPYMLAGFCIFYTAVTLFSPFMRIQTYQG